MTWLRGTGQILLALWVAARLAVLLIPSWRRRLERTGIDYRSYDPWLFTGVGLALLTRFVFPLFYIPSRSMEPTLRVGEGIVVNRFVAVERGRIVVFRREGQFLVKRLIGLGGDRLELRGGVLRRNGQPVPEVYLSGPAGADFAEIQVEPGRFFVLGDNRNNSHDSRSFGSLPLSEVEGAVVWRYFPLNRIGSVR